MENFTQNCNAMGYFLLPGVDAGRNIHWDAIRSEQFENGHFWYAYNLWTSRETNSEQIITFARHEYGRVWVFRIKIRSLVQKL